jgi:hypothetical protein
MINLPRILFLISKSSIKLASQIKMLMTFLDFFIAPTSCQSIATSGEECTKFILLLLYFSETQGETGDNPNNHVITTSCTITFMTVYMKKTTMPIV